MPKATTYLLAWSVTHHTYIFFDRHAETTVALDEISLAWHELLQQATSFAFQGQHGTYTARKEQIKPGDWYWYAYRRQGKKVQKKYLGKLRALSLQRLEEIAMCFAEKQAIADEPVARANSVHASKNIGQEQLLFTRANRVSATKRIGQEQLLQAKLRVPLPSQHLIVRSALCMSLQKVLVHPVTLLSAPAGFGKTTLISSWLWDSSIASAWLSLRLADNDPVRFWSYFFTALDELYPGVGAYGLQALYALHSPVIEQLLAVLLNVLSDLQFAMQAAATEALLVLDDYHLLSDEAFQRDLAFFLEHVPLHLHVIISARHDPPLPLARLRVAAHLFELRAADLRFTSEEIAAFFARYTGVILSSEEIGLLEARTGGWVAGLQLIALILRDQHGEHPDILQSIYSSQRSLEEYLGQEILVHLPDAIQQFLLRTSILEHLEGGLCEIVCDQPDGEKILAWLFQADLFLVPLDESRRWYRYHQIFADVLYRRLQATAATQIPELHRRAACWYQQQGMLTEAVAHAHAGEDWERIAAIAEETGVALISQGEMWMVMSWVALLPRALVFARLRLFLFDCWYRWYSGQVAIVVEMFREYTQQHTLPGLDEEDVSGVEQAINAHVDAYYPETSWSAEQRANRVAEMLALYGVLAMRRSDGAAFSKAICQCAVAYVAGMKYRARIAQHLGAVVLLRGEFTEAITVFEDALASAIADGSATWIASIGYRLGVLYNMMGQLRHITRIAEEILQLTNGKAFLVQATAYIFLGNVEYQRNNLDAAERFYKLAMAVSREEADLVKEGGPYIPLLVGLLQLARIQYIRKDRAGALQSLDAVADFLAHNRAGAEILPVVKGEYALLKYDLGDAVAVRQWLDEFLPPEQSEQMLLRQFISLNPSHHLTYARVLFVCQRWPEVELLVQDQLERARQQGRTGDVIQWLTLHALLQQERHETDQALLSLGCALCLAESGGYMRQFIDEGAPLLTLLYRLRRKLHLSSGAEADAPTADYLERLILLLSQEQQSSVVVHAKDASFVLLEPLSEREREVLWHISEGHSNREIADLLFIAQSTVKSHVRAIYNKLGVESRTQALARVRTHKPF